MTPTDIDRFVDEVMKPLRLMFREEPNPKLDAAYFAALADLDFPTVLRAAHRAIQTLTFWPKVAELRTLAVGSLEHRAALAWSRVYNACGAGYYEPITFDDPLIHAVVVAMGGWAEIHGLSYVDSESVDVATKRKEFLQLYPAILNRGVPSDTPKALAAGPPSVVGSVVRAIGEGGELLPLPGGVTKALAPAAPPVAEPLADYSERLKALAAETARKVPSPVRRAVVDRPVMEPPTAEEIAEHERKKAAALERAKETA